jgi:hypothetical protein
MKAHMDTKTGALIILAVAVIVGIVIYAFVQSPGSSTPSTTPSPTPVAIATPSYAPQGQLAAGFPQSLILDSGANISASYTIAGSSQNQYTAEWNSKSSMAAEYSAYKTYLTANGWTITNDNAGHVTFQALYASNASATVSVGVVAAASGSQVTVSYAAN